MSLCSLSPSLIIFWTYDIIEISTKYPFLSPKRPPVFKFFSLDSPHLVLSTEIHKNDPPPSFKILPLYLYFYTKLLFYYTTNCNVIPPQSSSKPLFLPTESTTSQFSLHFSLLHTVLTKLFFCFVSQTKVMSRR